MKIINFFSACQMATTTNERKYFKCFTMATDFQMIFLTIWCMENCTVRSFVLILLLYKIKFFKILFFFRSLFDATFKRNTIRKYVVI